MFRKIKFGKIAIVIFLTILIWVWTDLDLDESLSVPRATISAAYNDDLLVSFNGQPEMVINNIRLEGPARKISEVRRDLNKGTQEFDFTLNPKQENMLTTDSHTLNVLDFLKRSDTIKKLGGVTVEYCEPDTIDVNVVKLEKKLLDIDCFDDNGVPLNVESIDPPKVEMYVPEGSRIKAQARLTNININNARTSGTEVVPFIVLEGQRRNFTGTVKVKMSPKADSLTRHSITASVGFQFSKNLLGRYDVDIENITQVVTFFILATPDAKNAYESRNFMVTLEILDEDEKKPPDTIHSREVIYNFPPEYLEKNEIKLEGEPVVARFKLIPLRSAENPASGTN
jgi:hypothetical protein